MAESFDEMVRQSTASAPSSAACWKAAMKMPGCGSGRLGQVALALAAAPELLGRELAPVLELLGAESNRQGNHDQVVLFDQIVGEVTGAVGHDPHTGHEHGVCHGDARHRPALEAKRWRATSRPEAPVSAGGRSRARGPTSEDDGHRRRTRRGRPRPRRRPGRRGCSPCVEPERLDTTRTMTPMASEATADAAQRIPGLGVPR